MGSLNGCKSPSRRNESRPGCTVPLFAVIDRVHSVCRFQGARRRYETSKAMTSASTAQSFPVFCSRALIVASGSTRVIGASSSGTAP